MCAHTKPYLRDQKSNRRKINISSNHGNLTLYHTQPPDLLEISKKQRSQSRFARGPGSHCEHRRSFLTLAFQPGGTVRGHEISAATLHSSSHPSVPPGPCGSQLRPPPASSLQCRRWQMDAGFVIIARARRLGTNLDTE